MQERNGDIPSPLSFIENLLHFNSGREERGEKAVLLNTVCVFPLQYRTKKQQHKNRGKQNSHWTKNKKKCGEIIQNVLKKHEADVCFKKTIQQREIVSHALYNNDCC